MFPTVQNLPPFFPTEQPKVENVAVISPIPSSPGISSIPKIGEEVGKEVKRRYRINREVSECRSTLQSPAHFESTITRASNAAQMLIIITDIVNDKTTNKAEKETFINQTIQKLKKIMVFEICITNISPEGFNTTLNRVQSKLNTPYSEQDGHLYNMLKAVLLLERASLNNGDTKKQYILKARRAISGVIRGLREVSDAETNSTLLNPSTRQLR